jgi:hypothetical protein
MEDSCISVVKKEKIMAFVMECRSCHSGPLTIICDGTSPSSKVAKSLEFLQKPADELQRCIRTSADAPTTENALRALINDERLVGWALEASSDDIVVRDVASRFFHLASYCTPEMVITAHSCHSSVSIVCDGVSPTATVNEGVRIKQTEADHLQAQLKYLGSTRTGVSLAETESSFRKLIEGLVEIGYGIEVETSDPSLKKVTGAVISSFRDGV